MFENPHQKMIENTMQIKHNYRILRNSHGTKEKVLPGKEDRLQKRMATIGLLFPHSYSNH